MSPNFRADLLAEERCLARRAPDPDAAVDRPAGRRPNDDLREIGLTSLDMVDLVLSVESEFNVRIPEAAITPANFRSIATIDALIRFAARLTDAKAAGPRREASR